MQYTVNSRGYNHFEVFNEQDDPVGTLDINSWWMHKASIATAAGMNYAVAPKGFWQTTFTISRYDVEFVSIKARLGGRVHISFANENRGYTFRQKSFWGRTFAIYDEDGHEIAEIESGFNWRKWNYNYTIDVHGNTLDKEANQLLPFLMIYCARYIRIRRSAAT
ncbi:MAG: hypothetical protein H6550_08000 [Chitinophagales bacterium]|nr:hypothetical protein [Chitinophagales bacterium]